MSVWIKRILAAAAIPAALLLTASAAQAGHQWGSYHWERDGAGPLTLSIGENHDAYDVYGDGTYVANWPSIFSDVVADWEQSINGGPGVGGTGGYGGAHLDTTAVAAGAGDIESFNDDYGNSGWLGIASIWISRGKNKHITRGESKVNEFYITLAGYDGFDEPVEWWAVMCQEIGHTFGLGHNDEGSAGGTPDDTCMNTETRPLRFDIPNIHDTEMLDLMYAQSHGGGGTEEPKAKKCHPIRGCPSGPSGAAVGHAVWAERYETDEEMFDAADAVVDATVLSSNFDRRVGRGRGAVPVTRVVLRVADTLSGFTRPVIVLEQTRGPSLELADDPGYVTGDSYTLYLREIGNNTYRTVNPDGRIRN